MKVYKAILIKSDLASPNFFRLKFFVPNLPRINNINENFCFLVGWLNTEQHQIILDLNISIGAGCIIEFENYQDFKVIFE